LIVDFGEVFSYGVEGGEEDWGHELNKGKEYDNSISIGIDFVLVGGYGGVHE
jgi:hypothetical protein